MGSISIDRDALLGAIKAVASVVKSRNTIPILGNLLIEASDGTLRIIATDLDLICEAQCAAEGDIATTVPAETFRVAVEGMRAGRIAVTDDGKKLVMSHGRARRQMPVLPVTDFPRLVLDEDTHTFDIAASALNRLLASVAHVQSSEETTRLYLCGILLCAREGALVAVASNGVSLAKATLGGAEKARDMPDAIIATKTIRLILSHIGSGSEIVTMQIGANKMAAQIGSIRLVAKRIDGTFPPFERFIPDDNANVLAVQAGELMHAGDAISGMVAAEGKAALRMLRMDLAPDADLNLVARDNLGAEAIEPIEASYAGDPMNIGVNSRLMRETIRMFAESSALRVCPRGPAAPITFRSDAEPDLVGVIQALQV